MEHKFYGQSIMIKMMQDDDKVSDKIQSFQVLRALSITLIFLSHCNFIVNIDGVNRLRYLGAAGVSLFIALSGFLTAMKYAQTESYLKTALLDEGIQLYKLRWKQFWKLHIITLLVSIPLTISIFRSANFDISGLMKWLVKLGFNASLTQAFIPINSIYFSFNAVSWYLSLTLAFALLTPIALKIYHSLSSCKRVITALVLLCVAEILLCIIFNGNKRLHWISYISPITRFFDFAMGGGMLRIAEYIRQNNKQTLNKILLICSFNILIVLMILSGFLSSSKDNYFFTTAVWTIPTSVLVASLYNVKVSDKSKNIFVSFGNISYEFFLFHQLVLRYLTGIGNKLGFSQSIATYFLALVISLSLAKFFHVVLLRKSGKKSQKGAECIA